MQYFVHPFPPLYRDPRPYEGIYTRDKGPFFMVAEVKLSLLSVLLVLKRTHWMVRKAIVVSGSPRDDLEAARLVEFLPLGSPKFGFPERDLASSLFKQKVLLLDFRR